MIIRVPESAGILYERITYPAGELQIRLTRAAISTLFGTEGVSVICRSAHQHLMELALLSDALHALVPTIDSQLILPYLPYSRADRRFQEGDCHGLKTFGQLVGWLGYCRIKTLDVHSFRAPKLVGNLVNINPRSFISRAMHDIVDSTGHLPQILLPDAGAARYGFKGAVQCTKRRDPTTGALSGFTVPEFERESALIVDDICDGGGTFIGLAQTIQEQYRIGCHCPGLPHQCGAVQPRKRLYLYVTHGIFSRGLKVLLEHFERIYTTDSVYYACCDRRVEKGIYFPGQKLQVYDCEPALLEEPK